MALSPLSLRIYSTKRFVREQARGLQKVPLLKVPSDASVSEIARSTAGLLVPSSETARLLERTDWSRTPLGPREAWPQALRIAVGICLNSRFPMFVWWGRELI